MYNFGSSTPVLNNLVLWIDSMNPKSYNGIGITVSDLSSNQLKGTINGGVTYSNTNKGELIFNGSTGYISVATTQAFTSSYTIISYVKLPTNEAVEILSRYGALYQFEVWITGHRAYFYTYGSTTGYRGTNVNIDDNVWHHIVGVYDGSVPTIHVYVDGVIAEAAVNGTVPSSLTQTTIPIEIGRYTAAGYLNGNVGIIQMYNRALSQDEIYKNYIGIKNRYNNI